MDLVFYIIQFLFFEVIYLYTPILGGFELEQLRIFIAGYLFVDALNMSVFANNCWWLPIYINNGSLDYYLTKPVSSMFFLSLREFAANSFLNLIIATSILAYFLNNYPVDLDPIKIVLFILLLINGTLIYFFINFIFLISTLWTGSPRGFGDLFFALSHTMERPHRIYKGFVKNLFIYILPFALIASFPTTFLFSNYEWKFFFGPLIGCTGLFIISVFLWKKGLKNYTSASS
jgi:ABC-2 type transport system permease protein